MIEEIDIIELLKRVKEGKAPKRIKINETEYEYKENESNIRYIYDNQSGYTMYSEDITFDTKIKILGKPKIEYLKYSNRQTITEQEMTNKINEIIKVINNKEE